MIHADYVARPVFEPHRCSFTLRDQDPEGFFQGRNLTGPADVAYISVSRVKAYAQALGYVHPEDHAETQRKLDEAVEMVAQLGVEMERLREKFDAIDVLASAGFQARKKPGRPANQVKEAA